MRSRLTAAVLAVLCFSAVLYVAGTPPAAAPRHRTAAAPVVPAAPAAQIGTTSLREAKPHHMRPQHAVRRPPQPAQAAPAPVHTTTQPPQRAAPGHYHGIDALIASVFGRIAPRYTTVGLCIADRESHDDPYAQNPYSSAAGLFQFVAGTWRTLSGWYGFAGASVFNAYANASVAAHAMADPRVGLGPWGGGC